MMEYNLDKSGLNQKVENQGTSAQGKLSAAEFNHLVNACIESQEKIAALEEYFIPISESDYEALQEKGELEDRPYFIYED